MSGDESFEDRMRKEGRCIICGSKATRYPGLDGGEYLVEKVDD